MFARVSDMYLRVIFLGIFESQDFGQVTAPAALMIRLGEAFQSCGQVPSGGCHRAKPAI